MKILCVKPFYGTVKVITCYHGTHFWNTIAIIMHMLSGHNLYYFQNFLVAQLFSISPITPLMPGCSLWILLEVILILCTWPGICIPVTHCFWKQVYLWLDLRKAGFHIHIYKYVEIQFWNIKYNISWECKELLVCLSPLIHSYTMSWPTLQKTASWIACHFR